MTPQLFFFYHAIVIVVTSILIVTRRNPVHSIIFMLIMFFHIAGLYLFLNAEFLAAIQILVYAGAILVLFLFVVLLMDLKRRMMQEIYIGKPVGLFIAAFLLVMLFAGIKAVQLGPVGIYDTELIAKETHTVAIGKLLFTEYIFPFELASIVLLIAILGAIVLAKKDIKA